jgi:hypothetical protein
MKNLWQWINENGAILGWLGILSVIMFIGTLLIIPVLVARIPADYFVDQERHISRARKTHPFVHIILELGRSIIGVMLILAGIAMLLLPGQGILTILIGISLTNFPGKYALERKLVSQPSVFKAINWLRERAGKPPLLHPQLNTKN